MRIVKSILLVFMFMLLSNITNAQNFLGGKDLSTVKVDALTETQINQVKTELQKKGLTIDQVESQAIAKGMSPSEFAKLKARVGGDGVKMAKSKPASAAKVQNKSATTINDTASVNYNLDMNPLVYGSELFTAAGKGNESNKSIATPLNYEIGPNDVLKLVVYLFHQNR